jgi:hypothetical protein
MKPAFGATNSTYGKIVLVLVSAVALILLSGRGVAAGSEDWESAARKLEGTWRVHVTQLNCQTHAPIAPPFLSLLTFHRGGTLTETTSNPMFFRRSNVDRVTAFGITPELRLTKRPVWH